MACKFCTTAFDPTLLIKETNAVRVALASPRLVAGHVVVFPKAHSARLSELSWETRSELFETVMEFQEKIMDRLASGCDIRYTSLPALPQHSDRAEHLHVHLYPREVNDDLFCRSQVFELALLKDITLDEKVTIPRLLKDVQ